MHTWSKFHGPAGVGCSDGSGRGDRGIGSPRLPPDVGWAVPSRNRGAVRRKAVRRVRSTSDGSREKLHAANAGRPVPRTDTRGLAEYAKASERTVVKELCKIAP